jgi:hypothetical protein
LQYHLYLRQKLVTNCFYNLMVRSDLCMCAFLLQVYFADDSFGQGTFPEGDTPPEKVKGEPWMFVLRDVLQFSDSLESGIQRITDSNRTCNLIIGLGDGEENMVNGKTRPWLTAPV